MNALETALRDTLRERATDIDTLPSRLAQLEDRTEVPIDEELLDARPPRHSAWLLAAAVALIVAVAGAVIGVRQLSGSDSQPATPNPTSSPSKPTETPRPSHTHSALPPAALVCQAQLPAAWQTAFGSAPSAEGAQSATPIQVLPNGDVLVSRDFGQGGSRDLALVSAGEPPRSVFSVPDPQELNVQSAGISGNWLMVSVGAHPRPRKGTIPGDSPMPNVVHLYVIDLRDGTRKQIASTSLLDGRTGGRTINLAVMLDGKIYWDVRSHYSSRTGVIKSYDPATGRTTTVYSGEMGYLVSSAAGIGTGSKGQVYVQAPLPSVVRDSLSAQYPLTVATDGNAYVWEVAPRELGWWQPGMTTPHYLRLREPAGFGSMVVSGQYVMTVQGGEVIDAATGAAAAYPAAAKSAPNLRWLSYGTTSYGTIVAGLDLVGTGRWQAGYWLDPQPELTQFDSSALPHLHC